jgi:hypothetical protein
LASPARPWRAYRSPRFSLAARFEGSYLRTFFHSAIAFRWKPSSAQWRATFSYCSFAALKLLSLMNRSPMRLTVFQSGFGLSWAICFRHSIALS